MKSVSGEIARWKAIYPGVREVVMSPEGHDRLCIELADRDGQPVRVYCVHGVRVIIEQNQAGSHE